MQKSSERQITFLNKDKPYLVLDNNRDLPKICRKTQ
jgi:hypothetical protein